MPYNEGFFLNDINNPYSYPQGRLPMGPTGMAALKDPAAFKEEWQLRENPYQEGTADFANFDKEQSAAVRDWASAPIRPKWESQIDPTTGLLKANLLAKDFGVKPEVLAGMEKRFGNVQLNRKPLEALEGEAMRSGPSAWANLMQKSIEQKKAAGLDESAARAKGANAAAESALMMRGGAGSGARTSLAKDLARNINAGAQGVNAQAADQSLNVGLQDETNRLGLLQNLPGQELAAMAPELQKATALNAADLNSAQFNANKSSQADQFNITNTQQENLQKRAFDTNNYNEMMKAWAAKKTADATEDSGKK